MLSNFGIYNTVFHLGDLVCKEEDFLLNSNSLKERNELLFEKYGISI